MEENKYMIHINLRKIILIIFIATFILLNIILIFGQFLITHDPYHTDALLTLQKPNKEHILGCDHLGRDIYSRTIIAMQSSLLMAIIGVSIIFITGVTLGVMAGYFEGYIDNIIMRLADMMLAFPGIVLSIAIVGILGPGTRNTLIALIIPGWAEYARMARALTISEKKNEYITTAILNGNNQAKIIYRHIMPNIIPQLVIFTALSISGFILKFSGLAFLGLGFRPPRPEIGLMLSEAKDYMQVAPFYMLYPGIALFMIVFVFNALANILNGRSKSKRVFKSGRRKSFGTINSGEPFSKLFR